MKILLVEKKHCQLKNIFNKIRPKLKDFINKLKKFDTWIIQLTTAVKFMSSKDNDEERVMHSKSHSIEIMINNKADY